MISSPLANKCNEKDKMPTSPTLRCVRRFEIVCDSILFCVLTVKDEREFAKSDERRPISRQVIPKQEPAQWNEPVQFLVRRKKVLGVIYLPFFLMTTDAVYISRSVYAVPYNTTTGILC